MNLRRFIPYVALAGFIAFGSFARGQGKGVVVIDAGHGGHDRGGVPGQRISEKDKCLDVALRLRRILQGDGYKVVMTREDDVFVLGVLGNAGTEVIQVLRRRPNRKSQGVRLVAVTILPASSRGVGLDEIRECDAQLD